MPKVTVVIPVYKAEKYIEKCSRHLFEQTLDDLELIFIDDCSPDCSVEIIQKTLSDYPYRKQQTRIVTMPSNSGQAAVRRQGIILAKGDYIIHCDSDDWMDTNLLKLMYDTAVKTNSEVVMCPVIEEWGKNTILHEYSQLGNDCQTVIEEWYKKTIQMYTVNKLVKLSVLQKNQILPFQGINMWEDNGLMFRVFYYAQGLSYINDAYYHYNRKNEQAMTHRYNKAAVQQMLNCANQLSIFFSKKPDYTRYVNTVNSIKFLAKINLLTSNFSDLKEYYVTYPESDSIIAFIDSNAFSAKGKVRFWFAKHHLEWLFVFFFKCSSLFNLH